jgi:hypothetical protein
MVLPSYSSYYAGLLLLAVLYYFFHVRNYFTTFLPDFNNAAPRIHSFCPNVPWL